MAKELAIKMTELERLSLINQFLILEKLYPEEGDHYESKRLAIERGYQSHYNDIFVHLWDEMPADKTRKVLDILEMYRAITWGLSEYFPNDKIEEKYKFHGFDGNNESEELSYCHYFIVNLKRYQELVYNPEYPSFNSHREMLPTYERRLDVYNKVKNKNAFTQLSLEKIDEIFES